jgi:D-xylose transport system substrate-binding protein
VRLISGLRLALGLVAALLAVTVVAACGTTQSESSGGGDGAKKGGEKVVAFLLPENVNPRWEQQDAPFLKKELGKLDPDIRLDVYNANNDAAAQQRQADQALTKGAEVLVVIPVDGEAAAAITATAAQSNVPVVAYDRMIQGHDISAWIQADMVAVGRDQAKWLVDQTKDGDTIVQIKGSPTDTNARLFDKGYREVLGPLYKAGKRKLGYDTWTQGWDPARARVSIDQALTKLDNNVQGVLASNDGNAGSVIASLQEQHLDGKVPVTGLDGTVQALQLMLQGKQGMTVWRPFDQMAEKTALVVEALLNGKDINDIATGQVKNEVGAQVPHIQTDYYVATDEKGVQYIIDHDPSIEKSDVCKGDTASTAFCKGS